MHCLPWVRSVLNAGIRKVGNTPGDSIVTEPVNDNIIIQVSLMCC